MGLSVAMGSALSGLRATQDSLGIVSSNISNSQTPGYIRRAATLVESMAGDRGAGVRSETAQRLLDAIMQRELRAETGGAGFSKTRADYASRLETLFGKPGDATALDATFNAFTSSLQSLSASPSSYLARSGVLDAAGQLASRLSSISQGIQSMRSDAEAEIGRSVIRVNELLQGIDKLNKQIAGKSLPDPALLDQRDKQIDELSGFMDIKTSEVGDGTLAISTPNGSRLLDPTGAVTLQFDARGNLGPSSLNTGSNASRGVGVITALDGTGRVANLSADGSIRSGKIAALFDARDNMLVQAQAQLDEFAANLASALSDKTVTGQAATGSGGAAGFSVDLTGLQKGNVVTVDYVQAGVKKRVSFVRVDDPSQLPLSNSVTSDPTDTVVGIDFSQGMAHAASLMGASLPGFQISNSSGNVIQFLDDGTGGTIDITSVSAKITTTAIAAGDPELALFVDAKTGQPFTNSLDGGSQKLGLSQRLVINPAVGLDRSSLAVYGASVPQGDAKRPSLLFDRLTKMTMTFDPGTGIGSANYPFTGSIGDFARQVIAEQGNTAAAAKRLDDGQQVALSSVQSRFASVSGVNIDQEMANLVQLQSAYAANARVVSAVKDMMDLLMRM